MVNTFKENASFFVKEQDCLYWLKSRREIDFRLQIIFLWFSGTEEQESKAAFKWRLLALLLFFQSGCFSKPLVPFWSLMKKFEFCSEMCLLHLCSLAVLVRFSLATLVDLLTKSVFAQPKFNIQLVLLQLLIYFVWCNQCIRYLMEMEGYCSEVLGSDGLVDF